MAMMKNFLFDYCRLLDQLRDALALLDSLTDDAFEDDPDAWERIDAIRKTVNATDPDLCDDPVR